MAAARHWRDSRRCGECHALAFVPCAHRPNGFGSIGVLIEEWPIGGAA